jgi:hypothetical protein
MSFSLANVGLLSDFLWHLMSNPILTFNELPNSISELQEENDLLAARCTSLSNELDAPRTQAGQGAEPAVCAGKFEFRNAPLNPKAEFDGGDPVLMHRQTGFFDSRFGCCCITDGSGINTAG